MFKKFFSFYFSSMIILVIFIFIIQNFYEININENSTKTLNSTYYFSSSKFNWPVPGNYIITSRFGPRNSPTAGASSSHSGIDISAKPNTNIFSVLGGIVTFTGFKGAGGYSITIHSNEFDISYCHVSPNYIVKVNDIIDANSLIGFVGPKYISNIKNNPYHDSTGKQTNGATTGPHLHLTIKKDGIAVNPLDYFYYSSSPQSNEIILSHSGHLISVFEESYSIKKLKLQ